MEGKKSIKSGKKMKHHHFDNRFVCSAFM